MSGDNRWEEIISSKEKLVDFLIECGSQREAGRRLDKDHKAIKYWMDKYGIEVEDYKNEEVKKAKEDNRFENKKEKLNKVYESERYDYKENDSTYIVFGKNKDIEIHEDDLKEFRQLYCGPARMTLAQCARELGISRKALNNIRTAFNITHDTMPFLDKEVYEKSVEELVEDILTKKETLYHKKLQQKEYDQAKTELKKYKKREYFLNKALDTVKDDIESIDYRPPELYEFGYEEHEDNVLVLNITDWHKGKMVDASQLLGEGGYDKYIFEEILDKYINEAITLIEQINPEKVYILNYGDGVDGPNAEVYNNQVLSQDIHGEDQIISYIDALKKFVLSIYDFQPNIYYSSVPGNHSKGMNNSDALANKLLAKMLSEYESITFNVDKRDYKIIEIYDSRIIQTHGQNIRNGKNTGENDILNMINMEKLPFKRTYIVHGHLHHERVEGSNYKRILLPSPVGGDSLSNNMMHTTSRPSQMMFVIRKGVGIKSEHHIYFD